MNEEPLEQKYSNGSKFISKGEPCGVETGGKIKVIEIGMDDDLIVEYASPGSSMSTPCPSGVRYRIGVQDFTNLTASYAAKMNDTQHLFEKVANVLEGNSPKSVWTTSGRLNIGDKGILRGSKWVKVMNLEPIPQQFNQYNFSNLQISPGVKKDHYIMFDHNGDHTSCIARSEGIVEALGFTPDDEVVVKYTRPTKEFGTPCPDGTVYLMTLRQFKYNNQVFNERKK